MPPEDAPRKKPPRKKRVGVVDLDDESDDPEPESEPRSRPSRRRRRSSGSSGGGGRVLLAVGGLAIILLVLGAIGWGVSRSGGGNWEFKEFSPPDGDFTVQMPGQPRQEVKEIADLPATTYTSERRGEGYSVAVIDVAPGLVFDFNQAFQSMAGPGGALRRLDPFPEAPDRWAADFEAVTYDPDGYLSGRWAHVGGRTYLLTAKGKDARLSNPDVRRFLDSFRLRDGASGQEPRPTADAPLVAKPSSAQPGAQGTPGEIIGSPFGHEFSDSSPAGGLLVGFEVGLEWFIDYPIVGRLRPIYRVGDKESLGGTFGMKKDAGIKSVVARPGYAVGAITARMGLGIDGFSVTFMKVVGDRLDPKDSYESEWVGNPKSRWAPQLLGGKGVPIVGLLGRQNGGRPCAIGLLFKSR
jgi:hypothetical protein